jgi:hypothetical protein
MQRSLAIALSLAALAGLAWAFWIIISPGLAGHQRSASGGSSARAPWSVSDAVADGVMDGLAFVLSSTAKPSWNKIAACPDENAKTAEQCSDHITDRLVAGDARGAAHLVLDRVAGREKRDLRVGIVAQVVMHRLEDRGAKLALSVLKSFQAVLIKNVREPSCRNDVTVQIADMLLRQRRDADALEILEADNSGWGSNETDLCPFSTANYQLRRSILSGQTPTGDPFSLWLGASKLLSLMAADASPAFTERVITFAVTLDMLKSESKRYEFLAVSAREGGNDVLADRLMKKAQGR